MAACSTWWARRSAPAWPTIVRSARWRARSIATCVTERIIPADYPYARGATASTAAISCTKAARPQPATGTVPAPVLRRRPAALRPVQCWVAERREQPAAAVPAVSVRLQPRRQHAGRADRPERPPRDGGRGAGDLPRHRVLAPDPSGAHGATEPAHRAGAHDRRADTVRVWMQMYADAGNLPLEVVETRQSGCRATALCAAVGAGEYAGFAEAIAAAPQAALLLSRDRRPSAPARPAGALSGGRPGFE